MFNNNFTDLQRLACYTKNENANGNRKKSDALWGKNKLRSHHYIKLNSRPVSQPGGHKEDSILGSFNFLDLLKSLSSFMKILCKVFLLPE